MESSTRWMHEDLLAMSTFAFRFSSRNNNEILSEDPPATTEYKVPITQFYLNYVLLVLNSFGLQNALERSPMDMGHFFARCHSCATTCATLVRDQLGPIGFLKYSPDSHFVQTSYAVLTLLKVTTSLWRHYHVLILFLSIVNTP